MDETDDFSVLMERVRQGRPEAIAEMVRRYGGHVRAVVRQRLHHRLRSQFDSLDFQQDVWASFFCGDPERHRFNSPEALIRFLCEMAHHKVVEVFRQRLQSIKYNRNREESLDQMRDHEMELEAGGRYPSPSQVAIAKEKWQRLLARQPPHQRRMLELLVLGYTHAEIAAQMQISPKMIQRFIQSLKQEGEAQ